MARLAHRGPRRDDLRFHVAQVLQFHGAARLGQCRQHFVGQLAVKGEFVELEGLENFRHGFVVKGGDIIPASMLRGIVPAQLEAFIAKYPHVIPQESTEAMLADTPRDDDIVIVAAARTPQGRLKGQLASFTAPQLGGLAIAGALAKGNIPADAVDAVLAKLQAYRMTKLGERRDVTLEVSRQVLELAL